MRRRFILLGVKRSCSIKFLLPVPQPFRASVRRSGPRIPPARFTQLGLIVLTRCTRWALLRDQADLTADQLDVLHNLRLRSSVLKSRNRPLDPAGVFPSRSARPPRKSQLADEN